MKSTRYLTLHAIFVAALFKFAEVKVLPQDEANITTSEHFAAVPFIIGGSEAAKHSWPWQLSIYHYDQHQCGAILLSKRYALTAAHCVTGGFGQYTVKLGAHDVNKRDWEASIGVRHYFKHANYSQTADGKPNDIAVIELRSDAQFTAMVQPINLTRHGYSFVGAECYITGWGRTDPYVVYPPPPLQEARARVISNEDCSVRMSGVRNGKIHNSQVCVYDNNRRIGSCTGDSGGPLSCRFPGKSTWVVVGVTSWGVSSCSTNYPSVYTRVSSFTEWIVENTKGQATFYPPEPDSVSTAKVTSQGMTSQPHSTTKTDIPQTTTHSSFVTQGMMSHPTTTFQNTTEGNGQSMNPYIPVVIVLALSCVLLFVILYFLSRFKNKSSESKFSPTKNTCKEEKFKDLSGLPRNDTSRY